MFVILHIVFYVSGRNHARKMRQQQTLQTSPVIIGIRPLWCELWSFYESKWAGDMYKLENMLGEPPPGIPHGDRAIRFDAKSPTTN